MPCAMHHRSNSALFSMVRRLNRFFWAYLSMSLMADHPFDNAVIHQYIYENAIFDVFLTGKSLFRRIDPIQAFATIAFSPFHAAFLTAILLHGYQPERRKNAVGRHTGYICTEPCPGSLSSAQRIPVYPVFPAPASAALHIPVAAAFLFYGRNPE